MESAGALSALLHSRMHHHTEGFDPCEPNHRGSDPSFNSTTGNATRVSNRCVDGAHDRGAAFVRLRRAAHPIGFPRGHHVPTPAPTCFFLVTRTKKACVRNSLISLVGPEGLEPSTDGLRVRCSTN